MDDKGKNVIWLNLASIFWAVIGVLAICPAVFFVAFYDSPVSGAGLGGLDAVLILSMVAFPVVCLGSSVLTWLMRRRNVRMATFTALLPLLVLLVFFGTIGLVNWSDCGSLSCVGAHLLKNQDTQAQIGECTQTAVDGQPQVDGGDGLVTSGCGTLEMWENAEGTFDSGSEAHNWEITLENPGQVSITVENDGQSCPLVKVLDPSGQVLEAFEERNNLRLCPAGMTSTSFYTYLSPTAGTLIIRLTSPQGAGTSWVKVK
jgi:hypothetical protein